MDEDLFNDFFSDCGGRLDRNNLPSKVAARYEHQAKRAQRLIKAARKTFPKVPLIHFDFVDSDVVNAWAFRHHDRFFIGMSRGLFALLYSMCFRMLANRHILPGVGNLFYERPTLPTLLQLLPDAAEMGQGDVQTPRPVDSDRSMFAINMWDDCIRFFVGHEIAHIVFGHVEYLRATRNLPSISEFGWHADDVQSWTLRQTLELEADRAAVWSGVDNLKNKVTGVKPVKSPWEGFYSDPLEAMFNWAFAVCATYRLFGEQPFVAAESLTFPAPYQPMRLRQTTAMQIATDFVRNHWNPDLEDDCRNKTAQAAMAVERAFDYLTGKGQRASYLRDPDSLQSDQDPVPLCEFPRDKLKKDLRAYAYF